VRQLEAEDLGKKRGELQPVKEKRKGWLFFVLVVFVLLFPLIFMSAISTGSVANPPTYVSAELYVFSYESL
jgi:hypothetical protein